MKPIQSAISVFALLVTFTFSSLALANEGSTTITDETFGCLNTMTKVRGFFVDNINGDLDGTVAVAKSETGGAYPEGSVVQLVPTEVMVKQAAGTNAATNDWEFFELTVSAEGSKIAKRGYVDVVNRFGGNCLDCHKKAEPQWDMVCEQGHGCDPLPLTKDMVSAIQKTDPRCEVKPELTENEKAMLVQLRKMTQ